MRALYLYFLSIKSFIHKLRYDLLNEIVVALCSLVLVLTFVYIFNDFLNDKVASISSNMRHSFAIVSSLIFLITLSYVVARFIKKEKLSNPYFLKFSFILGESSTNRKIFLVLRNTIGIFLYFGIFWLLNYKYLVSYSFIQFLFLQIFSLILVYIFYKINIYRTPSLNTINYLKCRNKNITMLSFRLHSIFRSKFQIFFLILSIVFSILTGIYLYKDFPVIIPVFSSFISGFFIAILMSFQCKKDLTSSWIERNLGVSHEDFLNVYKNISYIFSSFVSLPILIFAIIVFIRLLSSIHTGSIDVSSNTTTSLVIFKNLSLSFKLIFILFICPYSMPYLIFQIDPKKPIIQILIVFMLGLFIATAVWVHWLGVLLVLVLKYYGRTTQEGRFYRV